MSRRRLVAIGAFLTPLVVWGAACTFPDVTFGDAEGEAGVDGPAPDGGIVDEGGIVASDGNILVDVSVRDDATAKIDPDACADDDCDCDKDTYPRAGCDAGTDAAIDCDDLDPLRHPNQDWVAEETDDGDWNCDGQVEHQPKQNPTCGGGLLGCTGGFGFIASPKCGTRADIYECTLDGLLQSCSAKPNGATATQLCR